MIMRVGRALAGTALLVFVALGVVRAAAGDQTYGKGVTLAKSTPIADIYAAPAKFLGKTIRIDGVVTAVCEEMGCWLALTDEKGEQTVRFKVDHDGDIVLPMSAVGHKVSAQGVLAKVAANDHEAKDAAKEDAKKHPKAAAFGAAYHVKATGIVVR
jgi:uncharacterized protein DUF4920